MRQTTVNCSRCGKAVTREFPWPYDGPLTVRAFVECPECVEKGKPDARIAELEERLKEAHERAERDAEASMSVISELEAEKLALSARLKDAEAQIEAATLNWRNTARAALESVEWVWIGSESQNQPTDLICPWCKKGPGHPWFKQGHAPDCARQAALRAERQDLQDE